MPVYNASNFLKDAIDSILCQTYTNFEFLIINDGSTDKSEEIIQSYTDPRIKYVKNETNMKLIASLNKGIELTQGKYIVRMDADDISLPTRIEEQVAFMEGNPNVAICGSWFESFGDKSGILKYSTNFEEIKYNMLYQCHICHPSTVWRTNVIKSFDKKFDPAFIHAEDYEFFTRINYDHSIANIDKVLLKYRIHSNSVSHQHKMIQESNSLIIKKRLFEKLGYRITEDQLDSFTKLNYHDYNNINHKPEAIQDLLEGLIKANNISNYINADVFNIKIEKSWFHYCYNLKYKQYYYRSFLGKSKFLNTFDRLKMLIKG